MVDVELRHLTTMAAIVEEGTFGRVGARLGYTQSTISQQIAALEKSVGGPVFERPGGPRPVRITSLGAVVLEHGRLTWRPHILRGSVVGLVTHRRDPEREDLAMSTPTTTNTTTKLDNLQSRLPDPSHVIPEVGEVAAATVKAIANGSIPRTTIGLVQLRAGQIVGSTYHTVGRTDSLREAGETEERITAVASWRDAPYFTDAERVALELVEAVLTPNPSGQRVPDELVTKASAHYDDKALWTLTLVISQIFYFIPIALIAQPIPGMPPGKNYSR